LGGIAVAGLLLAAISMYGYSLWSGPGTRDLVPAYSPVYLFDGRNVTSWRTVSGSWHGDQDDESASVLAGQRGVVARPLPPLLGPPGSPPLDYYRLGFAVQLHEAEAVELHFDLAAANSDSQRSVLRMNGSGCQLGHRSGERGTFQSIGRVLPYYDAADQRHYVRVERHRRAWWVYVDEQFVGALRGRHAQPAREFRFAVERGPAWFSDVSVEQLVPVTRPAG
jgi:hypothetical protein